MFRFTISAIDNEVLGFWEPNAPTYEERKKALALAKEKGFRTSVSIEPMLDAENVGDLIEDLRPHTTDCMWVGPMKMVRKRVVNDSPEVEKQIVKIISDQTPEKLLPIYTRYRDDPLVKWKGHFRKEVRKVGVEVPPQKDDWRDQL
jgi:DNA repair photolyase